MFEVLDPACEPKRATKFSSCIDLFAREDVTIAAGEIKVVPLGVKIDIDALKEMSNRNIENIIGLPRDIIEERGGELDAAFEHFYEITITHFKVCRSSLPLKAGLIIANGTGEIDLDYPDEIGIILYRPFTLKTVWEKINKAFIRFRGGDIDRYLFDVGYKIEKGEKIAQIKLVPHESYLMGYESEQERSGGYGSTGQ